MQFEVRAYELETLLDRLPAGVEVLSLDCFDTIIWRTTHAPIDVFAGLELPGSAMDARIMAESAARRHAFLNDGAKEIGLADVYRYLYPAADDATRADAIAHELALEARHAVAFAPAVRLIEAARRRGLRVVIVSDMYLTEEQLRAHIAAAAGPELLAQIEHVFVSSAYGKGKCDGLFDHVLETLGIAPDKILHVGDNRSADYVSAAKHGLHAVHLKQFDQESEQRLRLEATAATLLGSDQGGRIFCQPHRAQVALRRPSDAASALGHDVIGPVMHSFALWLKGELDEASARLGRTVKPLFVMRDGHLPFRVFDAMFPEAQAAKVELSRFVAFRASIKDAETLDFYMADWAHRLPIAMIARQLMLFEHEWAKLVKGGTAEEQRLRFVRAVRSRDMQAKIIKRCRAFTDKLVKHLATAGVADGDAVMLVDIGYNGTVQNVLTPVLRERLNLDVSGRYLFLREGQITGLDKRGMIDGRNYDFRAIHAMSTAVVVIEQLCNVAQGSTIDFTADGAPVRETIDAKGANSATRDAVQTACLTYVHEAGIGMLRVPGAVTLDARCRAAAASLARLFFLPNAAEVDLFANFDFDMNMGSAASARLVDQDKTDEALRRYGLGFGADREQTSFLSAELQRLGLPTGLGMFAATRFGLDLRVSDYQSGGIDVPVLTMTATGHVGSTESAWQTIDGYHRLQIPIPSQRASIGIQLGQICEWVQVDHLEVTPIADLASDADQRRTVTVNAIADGMEEMSAGLYRAAPAGLLFVPPTAFAEPVLLSLVFRPIKRRGEIVELRAAA
ncbi:HAD family hydrolase [Sphingomonas immobilis]|uniref:HAD family hydrolase n=1 Tax=Sphingomonas immobilis TaxID=3063997 RepID=A0ABT8ZUA0_9SPHN|nr:HAD family hydrolase [Sphingomonas sp. CA1-15]MDO7840843.1 HAD family hydrolase [Sphingomonas sp. CA1-15]